MTTGFFWPCQLCQWLTKNEATKSFPLKRWLYWSCIKVQCGQKSLRHIQAILRYAFDDSWKISFKHGYIFKVTWNPITKRQASYLVKERWNLHIFLFQGRTSYTSYDYLQVRNPRQVVSIPRGSKTIFQASSIFVRNHALFVSWRV